MYVYIIYYIYYMFFSKKSKRNPTFSFLVGKTLVNFFLKKPKKFFKNLVYSPVFGSCRVRWPLSRASGRRRRRRFSAARPAPVFRPRSRWTSRWICSALWLWATAGGTVSVRFSSTVSGNVAPRRPAAAAVRSCRYRPAVATSPPSRRRRRCSVPARIRMLSTRV